MLEDVTNVFSMMTERVVRLTGKRKADLVEREPEVFSQVGLKKQPDACSNPITRTLSSYINNIHPFHKKGKFGFKTVGPFQCVQHSIYGDTLHSSILHALPLWL